MPGTVPLTATPSTARREAPSRTPRGVSRLRALIREDYETHDRALSNPSFRALVVYRVNSWRLTVSPRILRAPLTVLARWGFRWIRNRYGIELPPTAAIGRRVKFVHPGGIVIHRYAVIGDDCRILHGVTLGAVDSVDRDAAPRIGNRVRLGAGAKIIGSVTVGDDARIGPNAVVMSDVPARATAFTAPARIIYPPERGG